MGLLTWWFIFTELEQIVVWRFATVIYCKRIFHGNAFFFGFFYPPKNHLCLVVKRFWRVGEKGKILKKWRLEGGLYGTADESVQSCNSNDKRNNPNGSPCSSYPTVSLTPDLPPWQLRSTKALSISPLVPFGNYQRSTELAQVQSLPFFPIPWVKHHVSALLMKEHTIIKCANKHILHGAHSASCRRGGWPETWTHEHEPGPGTQFSWRKPPPAWSVPSGPMQPCCRPPASMQPPPPTAPNRNFRVWKPATFSLF